MILKLSGKVARKHKLVAIVDDDFAIPQTMRGDAVYHAVSTGTKRTPKFYAARRIPTGKKYLHVDVIEQYDGKPPDVIKGVREIDHIDGDSMLNTRINLRIVSKSEQQNNVPRGNCRRKRIIYRNYVHKKTASGYHGVYKNKRTYFSEKLGERNYMKWYARIVAHGKIRHEEFEYTEAGKIAAARQYDVWAREIYGDAAITNFKE